MLSDKEIKLLVHQAAETMRRPIGGFVSPAERQKVEAIIEQTIKLALAKATQKAESK